MTTLAYADYTRDASLAPDLARVLAGIPKDAEVPLHIYSIEAAVTNLEQLASEGAAFTPDDKVALLRLMSSIQSLLNEVA